MKTCAVPGCDRRSGTNTYCTMHRKRISRHGEPGGPDPLIVFGVRHPCAVPGCSRDGHTRGLCRMHYQRVRLSGVACPPIAGLMGLSSRHVEW